jgi:hypothetical protein
MELVESIESINNQLVAEYGSVDTQYPRYKVTWAPDQTEKKWVTHSREGFELQYPRVEERWKYRQYVGDFYVLERFLEVPPYTQTDLVENYSYEPVWVFRSDQGYYLPPRFFVCQHIIEGLHVASKRAVGVKYKDPESDPKISKEIRLERIKKLEEYLFGNESEIADALHYKEGIIVPGVIKDGNDVSRSSSNSEAKDDTGTCKSE